MIDDWTEDLIYEDHNGVATPTVYTDGSLLDPDIENFQRAGWGFFVAPGHPANVAKPLDTPNPSVFRADELRALMHAFQHCATAVIVRTDCKAAYLLVQKIQNGEGSDPKHAQADILSVISGTNNHKCIVKWMPAHLDEQENVKKRDKYFQSGGTQAHINGNCGADELAKEGANIIPINKDRHDMYALRTWLTTTVQNCLVDIWKSEKLRMFGDNIIDPGAALEVQNILDIEASQCNFDDMPHDQGDEEEEHLDDVFGHCDIDGNECTDNALHCTPSSDCNFPSLQETVSHIVGSLASVAPSSSCDNKNGLLHMSYTIDKSISTSFPECKIPNLMFYPNKFMNNTEKQTGPLDHFLLNSDFTNVMQELHSSVLFLENRPANNVTNSETVLNLVGVAPSASSSPVGNIKKWSLGDACRE